MTRFAKGMMLAAAIPLAGCDWGASVTLSNEAGAVVAEQIRKVAAQDGFARSGRWQVAITLKQIEATGVPEAALAQMKQGVGKPRTEIVCLGAEDIKRGAFYVGEENAACRYDRFSMGRGRISGTLRCTDPAGTRSMSMSGDYGPDRYALTVISSTKSSQPEAPGEASVTMAMDAKRLGACTGTEGSMPGGIR